jgi:hypothetical protein
MQCDVIYYTLHWGYRSAVRNPQGQGRRERSELRAAKATSRTPAGIQSAPCLQAAGINPRSQQPRNAAVCPPMPPPFVPEVLRATCYVPRFPHLPPRPPSPVSGVYNPHTRTFQCQCQFAITREGRFVCGVFAQRAFQRHSTRRLSYHWCGGPHRFLLCAVSLGLCSTHWVAVALQRTGWMWRLRLRPPIHQVWWSPPMYITRSWSVEFPDINAASTCRPPGLSPRFFPLQVRIKIMGHLGQKGVLPQAHAPFIVYSFHLPPPPRVVVARAQAIRPVSFGRSSPLPCPLI